MLHLPDGVEDLSVFPILHKSFRDGSFQILMGPLLGICAGPSARLAVYLFQLQVGRYIAIINIIIFLLALCECLMKETFQKIITCHLAMTLCSSLLRAWIIGAYRQVN